MRPKGAIHDGKAVNSFVLLPPQGVGDGVLGKGRVVGVEGAAVDLRGRDEEQPRARRLGAEVSFSLPHFVENPCDRSPSFRKRFEKPSSSFDEDATAKPSCATFEAFKDVSVKGGNGPVSSAGSFPQALKIITTVSINKISRAFLDIIPVPFV